MTRQLLITVIGKSARDPRDPVPLHALAAAEEVGRLLAERAGGLVVGILTALEMGKGVSTAGGERELR